MAQNTEWELLLLQREVADLKVDVERLCKDVEDLTAAWRTASNLVAFMKWLAGAVAATGVIYAAAKQWIWPR